MRGIYEAWKVPGGKEVQERITATEAKPIGATIIVASSYRKLRIYHDDRHAPYCWVVSENHPVGTVSAIDNYEQIDEFRTLREARVFARKHVLS